MTSPHYFRIDGIYDAQTYWERVKRSEVFLGLDQAHMRASQEKIAGATVGVAGLGGVGGAVAMLLARLGVRHLKIADPDAFDTSNINRQLGASPATLGASKASTIAKLIHETTPDVTLDVYTDGLTVENASDFVTDCDLLIDCIDFYTIAERYALHQAFRDSPNCMGCLSSKMVGYGANLYLFTKDGLTLEDFYGIAPGTEMTPELMDKLVRLQAAFLPRFPSLEVIYDWMQEVGTAPMIATTPPLTHYLVGSRAALMLAGLDQPPYCDALPPMPSYLWVDATRGQCGIYEFNGAFANPDEYAAHFGKTPD
ncbi:Molybdopterin or thiamine biosynthesis adenylyltransferase [Yoonia tamlensis]|uniref:Molybdopterin or thiamine biosynthesis adenylyltransferase n=1 Tax=Yoonia tamlensis TaxID=390270 RepID=A0A1I6GQ90_9RHOB|nr:ThiF family adenylyltransferase [Yoonia tamlensis]SFR44415.1 Molybdopterin or thiamine biosynthesis adenylyltransferase [Yoonia tamlensis]